MQIALDAMGGDYGSEELIAGALLAVRQTGLSVSLVGNESLLSKHLDNLSSRFENSQVDQDCSFISGH